MTRGKLAALITTIVVILNFITYCNVYGQPYNNGLFEHGIWTFFTGISFAIVSVGISIITIIYILENWDEKL